MNFENIAIEDLEGGIRLLTINREAKLNALNKKTLEELNLAIDHLEKDDQARVVLVTGSGNKAFVAGADISEFSSFSVEEGKNLAEVGQKTVFNKIENSKLPFIALINGFALGGGLELALACHVRICSDNAKMGLPETSLGLIPGYGGTQRLTQIVGKGHAMEMILTGDMIDAQRALQIGLVNHVVEPEKLIETGKNLGNRMGLRSKNAISVAIEVVNACWDKNLNGFEQEIEAFGKCFGTPDFNEGVSAFMEKRKPNF